MISGGDEWKYGNGINLLKWAAIGLAVIALSWLIVSIIFYVIQWSTEGAELDSETSNTSAQWTRQTYQWTKQPYQWNGRSADVKH